MNKQIENILKGISRHKRGLRDPQIMHPEREWLFGMLLALSIFVLTATWSLTLYLENRNVSSDVQFEQSSETVVYRETMVAEALLRLEERARVRNVLIGDDTSLPSEASGEELVATSTNEMIGSSTAPILDEMSTSTVVE